MTGGVPLIIGGHVVGAIGVSAYHMITTNRLQRPAPPGSLNDD
jgi:hypothetical protein